ncbi:MAG: hypothetical protein DRP24_06590 [Thermotoga sp.]|nr:MAG: hypothetical protein DRP24_06590 [Thermotoga sp.]
MATVILKASFLPGTEIGKAIEKAKELAEELGVAIEFNFNGVNMIVFPWSDVEEEIQEYEFEIRRRKDIWEAKE